MSLYSNDVFKHARACDPEALRKRLTLENSEDLSPEGNALVYEAAVGCVAYSEEDTNQTMDLLHKYPQAEEQPGSDPLDMSIAAAAATGRTHVIKALHRHNAPLRTTTRWWLAGQSDLESFESLERFPHAQGVLKEVEELYPEK